MTIICSFYMGQGCMVAASRVCFAYARDDCFGVLSPQLKKVNRHTATPVNAVWFNTILGVLLNLLMFGGVAIGAIFSIGAIASYVAFTTPIFVKLVFVGNNFRRGPWHLGWFSTTCGVLSVSFVLLMLPILCFPTVRGDDLTPDLMNWTSLVYGAPMLFIVGWWAIDAHKWFKGPKINIAVETSSHSRPLLGRATNAAQHHMLHQNLAGYPATTGIEPQESQARSADTDMEKGSSAKD